MKDTKKATKKATINNVKKGKVMRDTKKAVKKAVKKATKKATKKAAKETKVIKAVGAVPLGRNQVLSVKVNNTSNTKVTKETFDTSLEDIQNGMSTFNDIQEEIKKSLIVTGMLPKGEWLLALVRTASTRGSKDIKYSQNWERYHIGTGKILCNMATNIRIILGENFDRKPADVTNEIKKALKEFAPKRDKKVKDIVIQCKLSGLASKVKRYREDAALKKDKKALQANALASHQQALVAATMEHRNKGDNETKTPLQTMRDQNSLASDLASGLIALYVRDTLDKSEIVTLIEAVGDRHSIDITKVFEKRNDMINDATQVINGLVSEK